MSFINILISDTRFNGHLVTPICVGSTVTIQCITFCVFGGDMDSLSQHKWVIEPTLITTIAFTMVLHCIVAFDIAYAKYLRRTSVESLVPTSGKDLVSFSSGNAMTFNIMLLCQVGNFTLAKPLVKSMAILISYSCDSLTMHYTFQTSTEVHECCERLKGLKSLRDCLRFI